MTEVHPALEAVARAIMEVDDPAMDEWTLYVPEARAALVALAADGDCDEPFSVWLREIAAEPKPTVEDVLAAHGQAGGSYPRGTCKCGTETSIGLFAAHQAHMLRIAGLLA